MPTHIHWLPGPHTTRDKRPNAEITTSSVVFVIKDSKVAKSFAKNGIKAAGVWYQVETYMNEGPDSS